MSFWSVRVALPNSTPGQATVELAGLRMSTTVWLLGVGFPPVTPNGPNCFSADRAAPLGVVGSGKHAESVAKPLGVGVTPPVENGLEMLIIWLLNPPETNTRFLTTGPPNWMPANVSLAAGGLVSG